MNPGDLDGALARVMTAPEVPSGFRKRLHTALRQAATPDSDSVSVRRALEAEHHARMSMLHSEFIRLRTRTLGTLLGVAFAAGASLAAVMPWTVHAFGASGMWVVPTVGAAVGVAIGMAAWLRRDQIAHWLI